MLGLQEHFAWATLNMPIWIGSFNKAGSPILNITVAGPFTDGLSFDAILDTGFTGFLSMPLVQTIRLGLVLHGTTKVILADNSEAYKLTAMGKVTVHGVSKIGVVILEPRGGDLLLGVAFLRQFSRTLLVSRAEVALADEQELANAMAEQATTPPQSAPTETP